MTIDSFDGAEFYLSNFFPWPIHFEGELYDSTEHAYQAAKTLDPQERARIRAADRPGQAKRIGRTVKIRTDWETIKLDVMRRLLRQKFTYPSLRHELERTKPALLVEGNNWGDTFWGVCNGEGLNWLGRLLMIERSTPPAPFMLAIGPGPGPKNVMALLPEGKITVVPYAIWKHRPSKGAS